VGSQSAVRLFVLLARAAPTAVVFRRGPSKQVLTLKWDMASDRFFQGQWFRGRIYEHRCDLSPSGERLVYFAAKFDSPMRTWTAVSRPPFLTALALWPKGDAWGGGGLFETEDRLRLNHRVGEATLAPGFRLPRGFHVQPLGDRSGGGEDYPIAALRQCRDGWEETQALVAREHRLGAPVWVEYDPPEIWTRPCPSAARPFQLLRMTRGLHELDGPWYITEYALRDSSSGAEQVLGRADWADWSPAGDLLLARDGKIYRLALTEDHLPVELDRARELIDLAMAKFEHRRPPQEARSWDAAVEFSQPSSGDEPA
jgi:hypothetical protein